MHVRYVKSLFTFETIECVKNKPTFKEIYELNGQIPQTFLRVKRAKISGFYFYMNTSI